MYSMADKEPTSFAAVTEMIEGELRQAMPALGQVRVQGGQLRRHLRPFNGQLALVICQHSCRSRARLLQRRLRRAQGALLRRQFLAGRHELFVLVGRGCVGDEALGPQRVLLVGLLADQGQELLRL